MIKTSLNRRSFLQRSLGLAAGAPLALGTPLSSLLAAAAEPVSASPRREDAKVAIAACRAYGPEVRAALKECFGLLGGIGKLVKNKTVTVKLNLTGADFTSFLGRPPGETYITHYATALALGSLLFAEGARRVRFVESVPSRAGLATTLDLADWDVKSLAALGAVEFENTRNKGSGKDYAHLVVPGQGLMFSAFDVNAAYADTDVMVSLAKLKNHVTAGVTLTMKNLFGITPSSLYGEDAGSEEAVGGRGLLHGEPGNGKIKLPGLKPGPQPASSTSRVPRIIVDICAARPIQLAIIDGITAMSGGEGPWCRWGAPLKFTSPGVIIAGLNPVSTDAVGTAVMGYDDPRTVKGLNRLQPCENHLLLAEQAGLGCADLSRIDLRGVSLEKARYAY